MGESDGKRSEFLLDEDAVGAFEDCDPLRFEVDIDLGHRDTGRIQLPPARSECV